MYPPKNCPGPSIRNRPLNERTRRSKGPIVWRTERLVQVWMGQEALKPTQYIHKCFRRKVGVPGVYSATTSQINEVCGWVCFLGAYETLPQT